MSHALREHPFVTIQEFDEFLETQDDPRMWELVGGRIIGMTNPTMFHEHVVMNVASRLKLIAAKKGCQVFAGGVRVQMSDRSTAGERTRPDIVVRCGRLIPETYVIDPLIIIEVLSPSTIHLDRGEKLDFHKSLSTLQHIALIYQDQARVEAFHRIGLGWRGETLIAAADMLDFSAFGCAIPLSEVYADVPVPGL